MCALGCFCLILLAHVMWIPIASLECHCAHPSFIDKEEHEALASFCIAYYARFSDVHTFSKIVYLCLHDKEFLRTWTLTHDPMETYPIENDSMLGGISDENFESARLEVMERKIPIHGDLETNPCRKYTTLLCWAHYWAAFPMIVMIVLGVVIIALHVQIYVDWKIAENAKTR